MKRLVIDYTPAVRQSAGIGRLIRGQVDALIEANRQARDPYDIRLFVTGAVSDAERAAAPLRIHGTPISERNMVRLWHRLDSPLPPVEWFAGGPIDIFHATDFVLPPSKARRRIVTVHDLAFLFYPDAAIPSLHHYLNVVVPRSVRRADFVIADSAHTARDLQEQWSVPAEKIAVVQGAVDHTRFKPMDDASEEIRVRERYGIGSGPYILALSRLEPRKNFVRLIEAFHQAKRDHNLPHCLVIGGGKGWLFDAIFARVQELGLGEHVLLPGFIPDADLPALYRGAEFFAYPSLYEGFGLPILEALACGTPVLTADNSCLPEAAGPGAIYVDALDTESIADGIARLANSSDLRAKLRAAGRVHAQTFTWQRSARQLLDAYAKSLGR